MTTSITHRCRRWLLAATVAGAMLAGVGSVSLAAPIDDDDPAPGPDDPLPNPVVVLGGRTTSSISMFVDPGPTGSSTYRLVRFAPTGLATLVSSGAITADGVDFTDSALPPDSGFCYRATVRYANGSSLESKQACTNTLLGQTVTRLQVEMTTGDITGAETNGAIRVFVANRSTYLDHDRDDFRRGDTHEYDIDGPSDRGDIRNILVRNESGDNWCVRRIRLLVNGVPSFDQSFASRPSGCAQVLSTSSLSISLAQLRADPAWAGWNPPVPDVDVASTPAHGRFTITDAELEQRVEGIVGDAIHGTELGWFEIGGSVRAENVAGSANTRHVRVLLEGQVDGPNATVTIDFDLVFSASQTAKGRPIHVSVTDERFNVDSTGSWGDDKIKSGVRAAWPEVEVGFDVDIDALLLHFLGAELAAPYLGQCCDNIRVQTLADGTVEMSADLYKKVTTPCNRPALCGSFPPVVERSTGG